MLYLGTRDGVYRGADRILDCGRVLRLETFANHDGIFAATKTGLYRSRNGRDWEQMDVPQREVYSVTSHPVRETLYAGTHPAHIYRAVGGGWEECDGFQQLPTRESWSTPRHRNEAHVRFLGAPSDSPQRLVAGVEVGGVHVSDDAGAAWDERRDGVDADVHDMVLIDADTWYASCGGGLFQTDDTGETWTPIDTGAYTYCRAAIQWNDAVYVAAAQGPPPTWRDGAGATVFRVDGVTARQMTFPGAPDVIVLGWTTSDDTLYAGTQTGDLYTADGTEWRHEREFPAPIGDLCYWQQ